MTAAKLCGIALAAVLLLTVIRRLSPELGGLTALCVCLFLFACALSDFLPIVRYITGLVQQSGFSSYLMLLWKALGVGLLTQSASDFCRDAGESAVAGRVELAGKAELLLLSLPLLDELLHFTEALLA